MLFHCSFQTPLTISKVPLHLLPLSRCRSLSEATVGDFWRLRNFNQPNFRHRRFPAMKFDAAVADFALPIASRGYQESSSVFLGLRSFDPFLG